MEKQVSEAEQIICENGGTKTAAGTCLCRQGFSGKTCNQAVCQENCKNGGKCLYQDYGSSVCVCPEDYEGPACEHRIKRGDCPVPLNIYKCWFNYNKYKKYSGTPGGHDPFPPILRCPTDINAFEGETIAWDEPTVKDNVGINKLELRFGKTNNTIFEAGRYLVVYAAKDYDGNEAICTFLISVFSIAGAVIGVIAALLLVLLLWLCVRRCKKPADRPEPNSFDNNVYAVYEVPPPAYDNIIKEKLPDYAEDPPVYEAIEPKDDKGKGNSRTHLKVFNIIFFIRKNELSSGLLPFEFTNFRRFSSYYIFIFFLKKILKYRVSKI
ncbi:hypothetical protein KUTeg_007382 [Tegillarca granosa]|uniref:Uncharacterized protein n=1 Tax=Tegillarca granosa TaxID=220873 RepID=A0ABQ9FD33_TEGGR|nr:hypothetical protein KUTeg_007382 [Tegillarca granosa]